MSHWDAADEVVDIATNASIGVPDTEGACVLYEVGVVGGMRENRVEVEGLATRQEVSLERGG